MVVPVAVIILTMIAMLAVYSVIHWLLPTWGTVLTNMLAGAALLLDYLTLLPWGTVLDVKEAALVSFAITAANGIMRLRGAKAPVGGQT